MYDRISYVIVYVCATIILAGLIYLTVTLPYRIKRALEAEPPRRRSSDINPGTTE